MNARQLRVCSAALTVFLAVLSFVIPKATAGILEDFSFWITLESIERVGEGTSALTGRVAGLPVRVLLNNATAVHDEAGQAIDSYEIGVGAIVLVRADWGMEGLVARAISVCNEDEMVMGSVQVYVNLQTVILSAGKMLSFADLKIGDQIFAGGHRQADGSFLALKIEVAATKR